MSTYYEYRDVKVMMAHKLMGLEGWKIYGYHADRSDSMTDYYCPADWDGVAEKNGYILCVDVYGAAEPQEIKEYTNIKAVDRSIYEKIEKLQRLTPERGATEDEAATAQKMLENLQNKLSEQEEQSKQYTVTGTIPGHMANPLRCNWHIEKDGIYIAKGNGILKYASIDKYYRHSSYMESMKEFKENPEKWLENLTEDYILRHMYNTPERCKEIAQYEYERMKKDLKLIDQFESFINKIDTTCGGMIGKGDNTVYKKVTVTKYKKEFKVVETTNGEVKEGQLFVLKTNFNYGHNKGQVFRIHESEYNGKKYFYAYKLNRKKTKECTGMADSSNRWRTFDEKFINWIEKGAISWCELQETNIPYEVEKVVKSTNTTSEAAETITEETNVYNYTYEVTEDTDTRNNSKIYLVKVAEKLNREEYIAVNKYIKSLGGYYSKFKHAFLFKENPADKLNITTAGTSAKPTENSKKELPEYNIAEDKHTKTGDAIWVVTFDSQLSRADFAKIKQKFATLKGFYSSYKKGFIFNYDPSEVLKTA